MAARESHSVLWGSQLSPKQASQQVLQNLIEVGERELFRFACSPQTVTGSSNMTSTWEAA